VSRFVDDFSKEQPELAKEWFALEKADAPIEDIAGKLGEFVIKRVEVKTLKELKKIVLAMRNEMGRRTQQPPTQ